MEALGIMLFVIAVWAWAWPEACGRWVAEIKHARDSHLSTLKGEK